MLFWCERVQQYVRQGQWTKARHAAEMALHFTVQSQRPCDAVIHHLSTVVAELASVQRS